MIGGEFVPEPLVWESVRGNVDSATLVVPLDYEQPDLGAVQLQLARHRARQPDLRIGTMLVNPGGPGFGGAEYGVYATEVFDGALLDRFDIIGWDPRGTGASVPSVDCIDDYDEFFGSSDMSSDQVEESRQLAERFAAACVETLGDAMGFLGTSHAARDIDSIRRALGEETITYFGFSYGSELGGVWATMFPETVRAAVFDGAIDPLADELEASLQQLGGFESTLATFLDWCSNDPTCAFHNDGQTTEAFDALLADLDRSPIPSIEGRPMVGRTIATNGVIMAMYSERYWPQLARALDEAASGNGRGLLRLHDLYYQRLDDGTWGNELEAFQVISCMDTDERPSLEEELARIELFHAVAPRLVPADAAPGYFCTFFPLGNGSRGTITGSGVGPIVVIGVTGDASTPLAGTRAMADALEDGRLVVVESNDHGGYFVSECARLVVNEFLIDLVAPPREKLCR
jgi:pimeloyl-ACP methyl ester carboxylesterase